MTTSGSWRIYGTITGLDAGERSVDASIVDPTTAIDASFVDVHGSGIFNAIHVPTGATAVLIVPDSANTAAITLKGVTGDTGIALHLTDPTTIALSSSVTSFGLTVGGAGIVGLRLIWS